MRIAWGISGAGHLLKESIEVMETLSGKHEVKVFLSRAGEEVARMYGVLEQIGDFPIVRESKQGFAFPPCGAFNLKRFDVFVISPATSNTVAKIRLGIADSLLSCCASQALKSKVPLILVPTDSKHIVETRAPNGQVFMIYPRKVDLEHLEALRDEGVIILEHPKEVPRTLEAAKEGVRRVIKLD
ncbi:2(4Fe-4S) ferredoxin [Palaeococcus pacificus DY20341]|uniref:2(4Fe-4S) ferredoxin n=1 Tax=Palaeococcus pacificus DY20341 TaxID=1343739 RepID=A0A075LTG9_9EURY|nr:flavoprotein [Palaeococcus pacificus]AIF69257.1 2(4Fe-4S) ferredoxin [Palaeococcus pacificus DY20341]